MYTKVMKILNPYNLGKKFLVEDCQKICVNSYVKKATQKVKKQLLVCELEIQGIQVSLTTSDTKFKGIRYWFTCPNCKKRVGIIFFHPILKKLGCKMS